jgi:hypothetical protein
MTAAFVLCGYGCSTAPTAARSPSISTTSPVASRSPAQTPSDQSSPEAGIACRLPFTTFSAIGFIRTVDGTFVADAGAATQPDAARDGFVRTVASPALYGPNGGETYDWAYSRWLPVPYALVSPDGSQYTYAEVIPNPANQGLGGPPPLGTLIHVVDVRTGVDNLIYRSPNILSAQAWAPEGIYLSQPAFLSDTVVPFYVWLLDPAKRVATQLLAGKAVGPVGSGPMVFVPGFLWISVADQNNPKAAPILMRVRLVDGTESTWFKPTSAFAQFLGLDGKGRPIVSTYSATNGDPGKTWALSEPNLPQPISDEGFANAFSDDHGLWLEGNGIFLYSEAGPPVVEISNASGGAILGPCG